MQCPATKRAVRQARGQGTDTVVSVHYRAVLVNKLGDLIFEENICINDSSATIENGTAPWMGVGSRLQCYHTICSIHCKPYVGLLQLV